MKPELVILAQPPIESWQEWEKAYIKYLASIGHPLRNKRKGGEGITQWSDKLMGSKYDVYSYEDDEPYSVRDLEMVKRYYKK